MTIQQTMLLDREQIIKLLEREYSCEFSLTTLSSKGFRGIIK